MTEKQAKLLAYPFTADEIEWRVLLTTKDKKAKGQVAAYIDSSGHPKAAGRRAGPRELEKPFHHHAGQLQQHDSAISDEISIYYPDRQNGSPKSDGAGSTDIEPIKGGLSNAFKRAASIWNIGRYLYELPGLWVMLKDGKYIDPAEKPKLTKHYNQFVNQYLKAQQSSGTEEDSARRLLPPFPPSPLPPPASGRFQRFRSAAGHLSDRSAQPDTGTQFPNTLVVLQSPAGEKR